ncbi:MAG TPA: valine--tRNA ligase [Acidimicrobiales bacterium]|nr:valine--tRNA ligase [Acidimicrobiales bacterium]
MRPNVPDKPALEGLEDKWTRQWESAGTYRFDRTKTRDQIYSVDTPPPTVSGVLHVGSAWGYTQADTIVRYQRMRGREVYYPMGWDDNGLPTERRVQNYYGVTCDPSLPYDPEFTAPDKPFSPPRAISRPNFVELCHGLTAEDEKVFEDVWRRLALSVDWSLTYATIDDRSRRVSQRMFLRNLARGEAYCAEAPTLWDVDFRTAVAQAELEDRETQGAYHRIRFARAEGSGPAVEIETTRPELIPACVALVAHPEDARYHDLFGSEVVTPLFGVPVPVVAHPLADPEKGSGIAMICTFGDLTDVTWWRELSLPVRGIVGRDGRLLAVDWHGPDWPARDPDAAERAYADLAGQTVKQAQKRIVEQLRDSGDLIGDPRPITHAVNFYQKGDRPLEIVTSRQWYIRNGARDDTLRRALLERGRELRWHPEFMRVRYEDWVNGLNSDWLISRQRFFGVPIPVWYPIGADGTVDHDHPMAAQESDLPVDPATDVPTGYSADQRDVPGGFAGELDIMDTWATSSCTPQIACHWEDDPDLFSRVYPMDLRPQGHDIIRTWLFVTVLRSHMEHQTLPWSNASVTGFIYDPDRKKMSKSKGNAITPMELLEEYGTDGFRYWATSVKPGLDAAFDTAQMRVGRRLAIKVLNASKFVLSRLDDPGAVTATAVTDPLDRSLLAGLAELVEGVTTAFEGYDFARALERTEAFFWSFCDDYLELVKARAYGGAGPDGNGPGPDPGGTASARATLGLALSALIRLLAPFLPFVTEEVWSWWQAGSVHRAAWPGPADLGGATGDPAVLRAVAEVLGAVRKAKSEAGVSMRAGVEHLRLTGPPPRVAALRAGLEDLRAAGVVADVDLAEGPESVEVRLAPG